MPNIRLKGQRSQLLTREFQQRARETAPKTAGKSGQLFARHQMAMKLAEMWMRPDIYGREFMKQFAAQIGISASRMFRFQDGLIATAQRAGLNLNSKRSGKSKSKIPTPKQTQALSEEIQRRIKKDAEPSEEPDRKRRRRRTAPRAAKRRTVEPSVSTHFSGNTRKRRLSKSSVRRKAKANGSVT